MYMIFNHSDKTSFRIQSTPMWSISMLILCVSFEVNLGQSWPNGNDISWPICRWLRQAVIVSKSQNFNFKWRKWELTFDWKPLSATRSGWNYSLLYHLMTKMFSVIFLLVYSKTVPMNSGGVFYYLCCVIFPFAIEFMSDFN